MRSEGEKYRFGYQGEFAEQDDETGWNAFELRMYDSQIGRWMAPDPYRQYWSSYVGMGNDPMSLVDPDGGMDDDPNPAYGPGDASLYANGATVSNKFGTWQLVDGSWVDQTSYSQTFNMFVQRFEITGDYEGYFAGNFGILGYADSGISGIKLDVASLEMINVGFKGGLDTNNGRHGSIGINNYIFKDGNLVVKTGLALETPAGDTKFGVRSILNYNRMKVKTKTYGGFGAPGVEAKYTHGHSGVHEFRYGIQEDAAGSYGPFGGVLSGFAGFTIRYNSNWPN